MCTVVACIVEWVQSVIHDFLKFFIRLRKHFFYVPILMLFYLSCQIVKITSGNVDFVCCMNISHIWLLQVRTTLLTEFQTMKNTALCADLLWTYRNWICVCYHSWFLRRRINAFIWTKKKSNFVPIFLIFMSDNLS